MVWCNPRSSNGKSDRANLIHNPHLKFARFSPSLKRCLTGCPDGVATLKVRKGAFDALNKGSGALGKVK